MKVRNVADVISALREAIPQDEDDYHSELNYITRRAMYTAPECADEIWMALARFVAKFANPIKMPPQPGTWQAKAVCVLTNKTESELFGKEIA